MAPSRFTKDRKARDVTPYRDEVAPASIVPLRPTTPHPDRQPSPIPDRPVTPAPAEWTSYDAPINFTWVIPDELCGMGWPKSRDQVRFLVEQGIDHLVSLSPEKIPPHYAFPDLKHTLIPVEDFTGPTIAEIQKFIVITDDARREGEAVGVHCAEGRGRTGVMCACYLIYYYDMEPWDAIRIMRRQRPGSVERKVQEETVVRFYTLLQDYGKTSVDKLEEREKQLLEVQKRQQAELIRRDGVVAQQATMNLLSHMHSFQHRGQSTEAKQERASRLRRAKSTPKLENEEEMNTAKLKNHIQSLLQGERPRRSKSQMRLRDNDEDGSDNDRRSRATTPGRSLLEEVSLKPVGERNIKGRLTPAQQPPEEKCELKNHFRDFMKTPALVKRGRSFSQPRDKESKPGSETETSLSRKESFEQKIVDDRQEQEIKGELANHTKRFLKRKSLMSRNRTSDDSDTDSVVRDKPVEQDNREITPSDNDVDDSTTNLVVSKPPPFKTTEQQRRVRPSNPDISDYKPARSRRFDRRIRSKSDITVPKFYDFDTELYNHQLEDKDDLATNNSKKEETENGLEIENDNNDDTPENSEPPHGAENNVVAPDVAEQPAELEHVCSVSPERPRVRKNNLNSNTAYLYMSASIKVPNSNPKPFVASPTKEKSPPSFIVHNLNSTSDISLPRRSGEVSNGSKIHQANDIFSAGKSAKESYYSKDTSFSQNEANNSSIKKDAADENGYSNEVDDYERKLTEKLLNGKLSDTKSPEKHSYVNTYAERRSSSDKQNTSDSTTKQTNRRYDKNSIAEDKQARHDKVKEVNEERKYIMDSIPTSSYSTSTSDLMNACKSGLRRLTYRKTYSRTRSVTQEPSEQHQDNNNNSNRVESTADLKAPKTTYTQLSSGTRLPSRPTTPGPYLSSTSSTDRSLSSGGLYSKMKARPTTPGPFTRDSWKRTNQKFNYNKIINNCSGHETYV